MIEFYESGITSTGSAITSPSCPHDMVAQILWGLSKAQNSWLYPANKPDHQAKDVKDYQINHIFEGIYPYVFHPFASKSRLT